MRVLSMPPPRKKNISTKLEPPKLESIALRYVSRYAASRGMLETVLRRHVQKFLYANPEAEKAPFENEIKRILDTHAAKGWINDAQLAASLIANARLAGLSRQKIMQKLQAKGIAREAIRTLAQDALSDPEQEIEAARLFARRKKLGPYAPKKSGGKDRDPKKEMARFLRAGFSLTLARKVLANSDGDD
jgi:regulatory protein